MNSSRPLLPRRPGGDRQPGKVVAGQEPLCREVAVGVEVALVDPFGFREQTNLCLRLRAQSAGVVALRFGPGVVTDDVVVKLALAYGGAIEIAPPLARLVEVELDLSKHVARAGRKVSQNAGRFLTHPGSAEGV